MKKLYAVIGDPIAHSMSPAMHNDLFDYYQIDAHYQPLQVKKADLKKAVEGLKAIGVSGFNVTVPHKVDIIPLLDQVDPLAAAIGAVNTVVNVDGQLIGYNTDGEGFVRGLLNQITNLQKKTILLIGSGGAARGIYFTLSARGAKNIDLTNRTLGKANDLKSTCPFPVTTKIVSFEDAERDMASYEVVIQTTSIGMNPEVECQPLSLHNLSANSFVSDIIYNPLETKFLLEARKKGAQTQNGIEMFVLQGALAFEKWTGIDPDQHRMENIVLTQLGGRSC